MAEKVKKEHYVPRRYLKYFSENNRFSVYDKEKGQVRPGNIEDYACEQYFYDVDFEALKQEKLKQDPEFVIDPEIEAMMAQVDEQHIEHWFAENVETWLFDPIEKIITAYTMSNPAKIKEIEVLDEFNMDCLALYLAVQTVRTKEFREHIVEVNERLPKLLMLKKAIHDGNTEFQEYLDSIEFKIKDNNYKKLLHAQFIMDEEAMANMAERFRDKIWVVGYNRTNQPFFTSDNPIIRYGRLGQHGFNSRGIEVVFPITTRLLLILRDIDYFWFDQEDHNHFVELSEEEVEYYNSFQVLQSYRYIFDKSGKFVNVDNIMKKKPELHDTKRRKIIIS